MQVKLMNLLRNVLLKYLIHEFVWKKSVTEASKLKSPTSDNAVRVIEVLTLTIAFTIVEDFDDKNG